METLDKNNKGEGAELQGYVGPETDKLCLTQSQVLSLLYAPLRLYTVEKNALPIDQPV